MQTIDACDLDDVTGGNAKKTAFKTAIKYGGKIFNGFGTAMNIGFTGMMALEVGQMAVQGGKWVYKTVTGKKDTPKAPNLDE